MLKSDTPFSKSVYTGVEFNENMGKWGASYEGVNIGYYDTDLSASVAYTKKMMSEKESFHTKYAEIENEIENEKRKIQISKNTIFSLKTSLRYHLESCRHRFDDGGDASKNIDYWHSIPSTYIDDLTGVEIETDDGYTVFEETCGLCGCVTK